MKNEDLLPKVIKIVKKAGVVLLEYQKKVKEIKKERKDFLTDADLKSNNIILAELKKLTPEIPIYSEEGKEKLQKIDKPIWVVDPLDGTVNFFYQDFSWGVSVALVKNRKTQLGVVYLPALNQLVGVTEKGKIITKGNVVLKVRKDNKLSEAQIWTDWGKGSRAAPLLLSKFREVSLYPQLRLCCTSSLLAVASGKITAYIYPSPGPEDIAAAGLILEKAGGKVTDFQGNPWTPLSKSIIASNGTMHSQILEEIKNIKLK